MTFPSVSIWVLPPLPVANVVEYFHRCDPAGKIIIFILAFGSLLGWTIMIGKYLEFSRTKAANAKFEARLAQAPTLLNIDPDLRGITGTYAATARQAFKAWHRAQGGAFAIGHVENALQRGVATGCSSYEARMIILGSLVAGAPFLGLLGTVWGVMDAFGGIANAKSASIAALAPGISGALLTTISGLLVAIPSVFGYNYLLATSKFMAGELEDFASNLADRIELEANEIHTQRAPHSPAEPAADAASAPRA